MFQSLVLITLCMLLLSAQGRRFQPGDGGICEGGSGLPGPFSQCGSDALSAYSSTSVSNDIGQKAVDEFISRKRLQCKGTAQNIMIACENNYQRGIFAIVVEADIPCYNDGSPFALQARYRLPGTGSPQFDEVDDICRGD